MRTVGLQLAFVDVSASGINRDKPAAASLRTPPMLAPDRAISAERSLQFAKLEVKFLIVPLKRALVMTRQGQFACSVPQNLNEAPVNYAHQPAN